MTTYFKLRYTAECNIPACKKRATTIVYGHYGPKVGDYPLGKYCGRHVNRFIKQMEAKHKS